MSSPITPIITRKSDIRIDSSNYPVSTIACLGFDAEMLETSLLHALAVELSGITSDWETFEMDQIRRHHVSRQSRFQVLNQDAFGQRFAIMRGVSACDVFTDIN